MIPETGDWKFFWGVGLATFKKSMRTLVLPVIFCLNKEKGRRYILYHKEKEHLVFDNP